MKILAISLTLLASTFAFAQSTTPQVFASITRCTSVDAQGDSTSTQVISGSQSQTNEAGKLEITASEFSLKEGSLAGRIRQVVAVKFTSTSGEVISTRLSTDKGSMGVMMSENCEVPLDEGKLGLSVSVGQ